MASESLIVALCGPTCSGTTALANEVAAQLEPDSAVLGFDEYDLFPAGSDDMMRELCDPIITNWEDPQLFDMEKFVQHLVMIKNGQDFRLQTRSRESMAAGESERLFVPKQVNITEGIFVLHSPIARKTIDLAFYIDIPPDVMVERRLYGRADDGYPWSDPEYIKGPMVEGTKQFVLPQREYADVVLDGEQPTGQLARTVLAHLT